MRKQWFMVGIASMMFGALGGILFSPQPANAVSREIVELQQQISQVLQQQQDLRSALDTNSATIKTLVQQALDNTNQLNGQMGNLQKIVQEVQANTGSSITSVTQTTQGLQDNLQEVQARVGKLSQQLTDMQNLLQSIDAKVSGNAPATGSQPGMAPGAPGMAPAQGTQPGMPPGAMNTPGPAGGQALRAFRPFQPILFIRMACAISPAGSTTWRGRNFPITSRISHRTIWPRTRSFIWAKSITRRTTSPTQSWPTTR